MLREHRPYELPVPGPDSSAATSLRRAIALLGSGAVRRGTHDPVGWLQELMYDARTEVKRALHVLERQAAHDLARARELAIARDLAEHHLPPAAPATSEKPR